MHHKAVDKDLHTSLLKSRKSISAGSFWPLSLFLSDVCDGLEENERWKMKTNIAIMRKTKYKKRIFELLKGNFTSQYFHSTQYCFVQKSNLKLSNWYSNYSTPQGKEEEEGRLLFDSTYKLGYFYSFNWNKKYVFLIMNAYQVVKVTLTNLLMSIVLTLPRDPFLPWPFHRGRHRMLV